jgi:hypothetical protein
MDCQISCYISASTNDTSLISTPRWDLYEVFLYFSIVFIGTAPWKVPLWISWYAHIYCRARLELFLTFSIAVSRTNFAISFRKASLVFGFRLKGILRYLFFINAQINAKDLFPYVGEGRIALNTI